MGSMATRSVRHSKNKVRGQKHPRKVIKNRNSIPNIIQHTKSKDRQHPAQDNHYPRRAGHHRPFHMSHLHINLFMGLRFWWRVIAFYYNYVIMTTMASQITSLMVVYSTVYSNADQRKHQSSASLAFVWGIHRSPVNSPHKGPVTRKMFPFDDVII